MDYMPWDMVISPPDPPHVDRIFRMLREHGIPPWESNTWYSTRELSQEGFHHDLRY
jgi:2-iminoacetate synthase ThiH